MIDIHREMFVGINAGLQEIAATIGVLARAALAAGCAAPGCGATAGFWFEPTSYASPVTGAITPGDMLVIEQVARSELRSANRSEQYFGTLRWGFAGPLVRARFAG